MTPLKIYRTLRLPRGQYKDERVRKNLIVLHHTAGADAESTFRWWVTDPKPIGTAFIIARDGTILEIFPSDKWAFHVAVKRAPRTVRRSLERRSIGIEIASAGWLLKRGDEFYKFGRLTSGNRFKGNPYDHGREWRGQRYFEAYTPRQVMATARLVDLLCNRYGIPREMPRRPDAYNAETLATAKGIISHANVRADKTDVHPGFNWEKLRTVAGLKAVL